MFLFTGCGSSGGGDNAGSSGNTGGSSVTNEVTGKVVYSGIQPNRDFDKVCYDRNGNKQCDEGEPFAFVSVDGSYKITDATEDDAKKIPLIAELFGNDASASGKILAKAQANDKKPIVIFETPAGKNTISSVTTVEKAANKATDLEGNEAKVTEIMLELVKILDTHEITIRDNAMFPVLKDMVGELSDIKTAAKEAVLAKTYIKNASINTLPANSPDNAKRAFANSPQMYELNGEDIILYEVNSSSIKGYKKGDDKDKYSALPTTADPLVTGAGVDRFTYKDNSVDFGDGCITTVETFDLNEKELSMDGQGSKKIKFSADAKMYKWNILFLEPAIDIGKETENIKKDNKTWISEQNKKSYKYWKANKVADGFEILPTGTNETEYRWSIKMEPGSYSVVSDDPMSIFFSETFPTIRTLPKGTYEDSNGVLTFKDSGNRVIFKVFQVDEQYWAVGYVDAGLTYSETKFNKTAMEDIIKALK